MEADGFEEWDDAFLEKVEQMEKIAVALTQQQQRNPPITTHSFPPLQPSHSPPRELSQRPISDEIHKRRVEYKPASKSKSNGVAPVVKSSSSRTAKPASGGGGGLSLKSDSEIVRLKKELELVSKQLTEREQECLELRKEREKKHVQLQSATLPKEAISNQAHSLRNLHEDLNVPPHECAGLSMDQDVLANQGSSRFGIGLSSYHTKGVQTEFENDDCLLPSDRETNSCDSFAQKLELIRRCSTDLYSGSYLVSKLFIVCATELQVLFGYCQNTTCSKAKEAANEDNHSHITSVNNGKYISSSDAAKVLRFYTSITRMSNGMVQFETFYKTLLDLFSIHADVIEYRSLRILNVVLLHFAGCQQIATRRDNVSIVATSDASAFCGTDNLLIARPKQRTTDLRLAFDTKHSCVDWLSIYHLMHQLINSATDESIICEAISIMNVILKRFGPLERERFGDISVFQTVPKFLKKDAGLRVQKEAVHFLYLLVNCPALLASLCRGYIEIKSNLHGEKNDSTFEGLSSIFAGLEDCLVCRGTVLEALELRRNATTLVSYLVSFGTCGHEVLWSSTACNRTGFLILILRMVTFEIDSGVLNPGELTDIVKERTLLLREALIFLNRTVSHPTFSGTSLRALTSSREVANLTVETTSRLSRKGKIIWQDDGITKQMLQNEIPNLARVLYKRISAYLGDNISL